MGPDSRRDTDADGTNALLNYGYTVLRAIICRAICAAGLHPTLGLHHSNRGNAFALADDLMEPYRPLVDRLVFNLVENGQDQIDRKRVGECKSVVVHCDLCGVWVINKQKVNT